MTPEARVRALLTWSTWQPLQGAWLADRLPNLPGLYRIRRVGRDDLDYIGQTGSGTMTLKKRLGMLRGVYGNQMPYRDPHTAGPALWALRHATGDDFEVSVVPVEGSTPWRKGLECVAISLYRQAHGRSPTVNFGRMPSGYRMSTGNNARLVAANKRTRGEQTGKLDDNHRPGIAPIGMLDGDTTAADWCGHLWTTWMPISTASELIPSSSTGLYRMRLSQSSELLYIGQGKVRDRLIAHTRKVNDSGYARQSRLFSSPLEYSFIMDDTWYEHERLELENDLIAAYVLATGEVPTAQFLG